MAGHAGERRRRALLLRRRLGLGQVRGVGTDGPGDARQPPPSLDAHGARPSLRCRRAPLRGHRPGGLRAVQCPARRGRLHPPRSPPAVPGRGHVHDRRPHRRPRGPRRPRRPRGPRHARLSHLAAGPGARRRRRRRLERLGGRAGESVAHDGGRLGAAPPRPRSPPHRVPRAGLPGVGPRPGAGGRGRFHRRRGAAPVRPSPHRPRPRAGGGASRPLGAASPPRALRPRPGVGAAAPPRRAARPASSRGRSSTT
jgi:hypothetical protein